MADAHEAASSAKQALLFAVKTCHQSFEQCLSHASVIGARERSSIESRHARFSTWAIATRSSSLDTCQNPSFLSLDIINILHGLLESLDFHVKTCSDAYGRTSKGRPSNFTALPDDHLPQLVALIDFDINRLSKIWAVVFAAGREVPEIKQECFQPRASVAHFVAYVRQTLHTTDIISMRLAEAMVIRRTQLLCRQDELIEKTTCPYCHESICTQAEALSGQSKLGPHCWTSLSPYVCLVEDCSTPFTLFKLTSEWETHMNQHFTSWMCHSHPDSQSFSTCKEYLEHVQETHSTTLNGTQLRILASRNIRGVSIAFRTCPLCGVDEGECDGRLMSHVAEHLESLALKSLPDSQSEILEAYSRETIPSLETNDALSESSFGSEIESEPESEPERESGYVDYVLEELMQRARTRPEDFVDPSERTLDEVREQYPELAFQSKRGLKTILHLIVDEFPSRKLKLQKADDRIFDIALLRLVGRITSWYPHLLSHVDNTGCTPLYRAIERYVDDGNFSVFRAMVFHCERPQIAANYDSVEEIQGGVHPLTEALAVRCMPTESHFENSLHLAMRGAFHRKTSSERFSVIRQLVEHASFATVTELDGKQLTPLHYALNYKSGSQQQHDIICGLLSQGDPEEAIHDGKGVLDIYTTNGQSICGYHMGTRSDYMSKKDTEDHFEDDRPQIRPKQRTERSMENDDPDDGPKPTRIERREKRENWYEKIQIMLKARYMRTRSLDAYMRFFHGDTLESRQTQINFDLRGFRKEIDPAYFRGAFEHAVFDTVLKYVALPSIRVRDPQFDGSKRRPRLRMHVQNRSDLKFFFEWLRNEKGVKKILRVIVEDSFEDPHCDEAIETALQGFGVESLEWSKPDLDSKVIYTASPDLTEVSLRWSGNNAILRSWSEPEGLVRLPNLRTVRLLVNQTLTSYRTRSNIDEFIQRLKERCLEQQGSDRRPSRLPYYEDTENDYHAKASAANMDIDAVQERDMGPPPGHGGSTEFIEQMRLGSSHFINCIVLVDMPSMSHPTPPLSASVSGVLPSPNTPASACRWLESTDTLAEQVEKVWGNLSKDVCRTESNSPAVSDTSNNEEGGESRAVFSDSELGNRTLLEVIVALIDDGVDVMDDELIGRVLPGRSFDSEAGRILPWFTSRIGHGTTMAGMIARVCPMAKILPIRLQTAEDPASDFGLAINIESAIKAIRAAVDLGASIISMSWAVRPPEHDLRKAFDEAIQYAIDKNVLLFCASRESGNCGFFHYYPMAANPDSVIKVGVTDTLRSTHENDDGISYVDFCLPGVGLAQSSIPMSDSPGRLNPETVLGSSVATALGAGLAAMIIYCARIYYIRSPTAVPEGLDNLQLYKPRRMVQIMQRLGMNESEPTQSKLIEVWRKLENTNKQLLEASETHQQDIVGWLARDLVLFK